MSHDRHEHDENCNHEHREQPKGETLPPDVQKLRDEMMGQVDEMLAKGCWAVIYYQNVRWLGRIAQVKAKNGEWMLDPTKNDILDAMPNYVKIDPMFDYMIQLAPNPEMPGVPGKVPYCLATDMVTNPTPNYLFAPNFMFLEDVHEDDRKMYKALVFNGNLLMRKSEAVINANGQDRGPRIITPQEAALEMERARLQAGMGRQRR